MVAQRSQSIDPRPLKQEEEEERVVAPKRSPVVQFEKGFFIL